MAGQVFYDLVVVGGGMGGLATAGLAQRLGLRVALLEAHTRLGGCAGYFRRGPYAFDAGATALMGLDRGEPIGDLLAALDVNFATVPGSGYRVHLPDRRLDMTSEPAAFEREVCRLFPGRDRAQRGFWRLQNAVGERLFRAGGRVPRMPLRKLGDLVHDLRILGVSGMTAGLLSAVTTDAVLRGFGLARDRAFRSFVAMLLQDTAQAGPETVPFANAAVSLQAYRRGLRRPRGGMQALVDGIGSRFVTLGGDLRTATKVDRIERAAGRDGFTVITRRRDRLEARQVALNLPLDLAAALLDQPLEGRLRASEQRSRAGWSAFTGYLAIGRDAVPDDTPLFHQVLQSYDRPMHEGNNVLISLSPVADSGYGPPLERVATLSTHTDPRGWAGLDREAHRVRKDEFLARMLSALDQALPGARDRLMHEEFATPRSFARYTRRTDGAVGGPPVARGNSNLLAVGSDVLGPGLWLVGDSVFPGQGTMATVLSAIRVVERITGVSWDSIRGNLPPAAELREPGKWQPSLT